MGSSLGSWRAFSISVMISRARAKRQALCDHVELTKRRTSSVPRLISDYVKANFEVLQLNIIGSRRDTFRRDRAFGKRTCRKIRRTCCADVSVFCGSGRVTEKPAAGETGKWAGGDPLPDDFLAMFRLRARKLREQKLPRLIRRRCRGAERRAGQFRTFLFVNTI